MQFPLQECPECKSVDITQLPFPQAGSWEKGIPSHSKTDITDCQNLLDRPGIEVHCCGDKASIRWLGVLREYLVAKNFKVVQ
jgi:hypothetical protein